MKRHVKTTILTVFDNDEELNYELSVKKEYGEVYAVPGDNPASMVLRYFQRLNAHELLLVDLVLLVPKVDGGGVGEVAHGGGKDM